jgi:hypothetical protein
MIVVDEDEPLHASGSEEWDRLERGVGRMVLCVIGTMSVFLVWAAHVS